MENGQPSLALVLVVRRDQAHEDWLHVSTEPNLAFDFMISRDLWPHVNTEPNLAFDLVSPAAT